MKLITPFTILNQNFHEMDLIREAMKKRRLATEKLHDFSLSFKDVLNYSIRQLWSKKYILKFWCSFNPFLFLKPHYLFNNNRRTI